MNPTESVIQPIDLIARLEEKILAIKNSKSAIAKKVEAITQFGDKK